jgi:hypothetical protein
MGYTYFPASKVFHFGKIKSDVQVAKPADAAQTSAVVQSALRLFSQNVKHPFNLTLLNLGAANFSEGAGANGRGGAHPTTTIARLLRPKGAEAPPATATPTPAIPGQESCGEEGSEFVYPPNVLSVSEIWY